MSREYHQSRDLGRARSRTIDPSERIPTTGWPAADRHIALQRAANARETERREREEIGPEWDQVHHIERMAREFDELARNARAMQLIKERNTR